MSNYAKVRSFDHTRIKDLPEYSKLSKAMDDLIHAINESPTEMGQNEWLEAVRDMASCLGFSDCCHDGCMKSNAPCKVELDEESLSAEYRCSNCGNEYKCWWSTSIAEYL